jgi:hypothetical protein
MHWQFTTILGMIFQDLNYDFAAQRSGNFKTQNCTLELAVPETKGILRRGHMKTRFLCGPDAQVAHSRRRCTYTSGSQCLKKIEYSIFNIQLLNRVPRHAHTLGDLDCLITTIMIPDN